MKIQNLQHCLTVSEFTEYSEFMKVKFNVDILFNSENDASDELSISGHYYNVRNAVFAYFSDDIEQIKFHCPEIIQPSVMSMLLAKTIS